MKKIVALVLSLVMALSLCTVAFGATGTVMYGLDGKNVDQDCSYGGALVEVKAHSNPDGSGNVKYYEWYTDEDATNLQAYMIPCNQDDATAAIYKNGAFLTWVFAATTTEAAEYDFVATAQKATTADPNCTTDKFFFDGYLNADGDHFFVEEPTTTGYDEVTLNVGGKIIVAYDVCKDTDYVIWASHIFAKGVANAKTGYDVAACLICKGEFACTNNEEVATKNGYKVSTGFSYSSDAASDVYYGNCYDNGYDFNWGQEYADDYVFVWQLKAGTTEEIGTADKTETTTGVESAKTFDAGIAMYVGMSLMSVAGTAVVIGKKKEF